jgi:hypothetical protein
MLNYTEKPQNTYIQSWTITEIMAREKFGLLLGQPTLSVSSEPYLRYVLECGVIWRKIAQGSHVIPSRWWRNQPCYVSCVGYSARNTKDNYDTSSSIFVVQFNGFMSLTS